MQLIHDCTFLAEWYNASQSSTVPVSVGYVVGCISLLVGIDCQTFALVPSMLCISCSDMVNVFSRG